MLAIATCHNCNRERNVNEMIWESYQKTYKCLDTRNCKSTYNFKKKKSKKSASGSDLSRFGVELDDLVLDTLQYRDGKQRYTDPTTGIKYIKDRSNQWTRILTVQTGYDNNVLENDEDAF